MSGQQMGRCFKSALVLCALAVVPVALLAGCGSSSEGDAPSKGLPNPIVLGAAISKSGYLAPWDAAISAVELLVEEVNAKGGIDGHKLKVIQADNRSDPQRAPIAAQQVVEEEADVLLFSGEGL